MGLGKPRGHSMIFRTSPRRSTSDFRVIVSRWFVSVATKLDGITSFTAATALAFATAATQRDFWPSGAVTSTTGILVRTFGNWGHAPRILLFYGEVLRPKPEKAGVGTERCRQMGPEDCTLRI